MADADEFRLYQDLMRFKPDRLTANGWAVKAGVSRSVWSDMRRHGNPSRRTLAKLLAVAGSSLAEFEALRVEGAPHPKGERAGRVSDRPVSTWRAAPLVPVPLLATEIAGEWNEGGTSGIELTALEPDRTIGQVARPASLAADRDAYAVTIVGDAMWPRFRPGRHLLVSSAAPVAIGDDVVVRLIGDGDDRRAMVLIKELVRRTASFVELRQFNPDITFRVEARVIGAIHKAIGEAV
jgi:SOS-response transcriptional repressor LexA